LLEIKNMITLLCLGLGALIGFSAAKSGAFREGAGLVLLFLMIAAVISAALLGAASALLPAAISLWTGRVALFCFTFAVFAFIGDRK
jgi:hypothetical protein